MDNQSGWLRDSIIDGNKLRLPVLMPALFARIGQGELDLGCILSTCRRSKSPLLAKDARNGAPGRSVKDVPERFVKDVMELNS